MVSINGNGNDYNKYLPGKDLIQQAETKKASNAEGSKPAVKPNTKELGDDLLDPRLFANAIGFVRQASPINKPDAEMLTEMYAMAGIKTQMPTREQYERISNTTLGVAGNIDNVRAEHNAERLFSSPNFLNLNEQFGII